MFLSFVGPVPENGKVKTENGKLVARRLLLFFGHGGRVPTVGCYVFPFSDFRFPFSRFWFYVLRFRFYVFGFPFLVFRLPCFRSGM